MQGCRDSRKMCLPTRRHRWKLHARKKCRACNGDEEETRKEQTTIWKGSTWCNKQHFFRADWIQGWTDCSQTLSWICPTGFRDPGSKIIPFSSLISQTPLQKSVCVCACVTGGWGWHTNVYLSRPPFVHPAPVCRRSFSNRPFLQRLRCHGLK